MSSIGISNYISKQKQHCVTLELVIELATDTLMLLAIPTGARIFV
jgi:hypothetical protein